MGALKRAAVSLTIETQACIVTVDHMALRVPADLRQKILRFGYTTYPVPNQGTRYVRKYVRLSGGTVEVDRPGVR